MKRFLLFSLILLLTSPIFAGAVQKECWLVDQEGNAVKVGKILTKEQGTKLLGKPVIPMVINSGEKPNAGQIAAAKKNWANIYNPSKPSDNTKSETVIEEIINWVLKEKGITGTAQPTTK